MPGDTLTLREINRATLARQMLLDREPASTLDAVKRLVAMQAQLARPPFIGLWSRLQKFDRRDLVSLLEKRTLVRATFLRGTIHLVAADDFVELRPAVQAGLDAAMYGILRERLDGIDLDRLVARARTIFERCPCTFEELRDRFLEEDPDADERAMGYAVRMRLPLVQVPEPDAPWAFPAKASFASAEAWLRRRVPAEAGEPDALVLRYLAAYGPANAATIQAWAGLSGPAVRAALDRLRPRLMVFRDEGKRELFDLPDAPRPGEDATAPVRLVPEYDNLIATRADERFVARAHRPRVFLSALRIAATVLVDGFVVGTWKLEATKKAATITIEPFKAFPSKVRREVEAEAEALVRFAEPAVKTHEVRIVKV